MLAFLIVVHLLGWALYLGGMAADLTMKIFTEKRRHPLVMGRMFEKFQFTDIWVTQFQVAALSISGIALVELHGIDFWGNPLLVTGFALFFVSGLLFYVGLLPTQGQIKVKTLALKDSDPATYDWAAYEADDKRWVKWANIVVITSFLAFILELVAVGTNDAVAAMMNT